MERRGMDININIQSANSDEISSCRGGAVAGGVVAGQPGNRSSPSPLDRENSHRTRWPQFGLATLMLIMLVSAVTAAIGSYVIRAMSHGTSGKAFFVMFTLIMPVLLVVILNLARLATVSLQRLKRRG